MYTNTYQTEILWQAREIVLHARQLPRVMFSHGEVETFKTTPSNVYAQANSLDLNLRRFVVLLNLVALYTEANTRGKHFKT